MKIAIIGRTRWLLDSAKALVAAGHQVVLVVTTEAAPEYDAGARDFEGLALDLGVPFLNGVDANGSELQQSLRVAGADLGISVNWPTLIRQETCDLLKHGILNAHAGDLPRFKGNACPNWAILTGQPVVGLCVHAMDPAVLDAGPIWARDWFDLTGDADITAVYRWLDEAIPRRFVEAVSRIASGEQLPETLNGVGVTPLRCHPRRPEDGLIDWREDAEAILRLVRASTHPFAGAFSFLEGREKVTIWRARRHIHRDEIVAVPGQIAGRGMRGGAIVICGVGAIEIDEATLDGGKALPISNRFRLQFIRPSP